MRALRGAGLRPAALCVALLILLLNCGGSRQNDPPVASDENLQLALEQTIDNAVLPAVADFYQQAAAYADTAQGFCSQLNETGLQALQAQWRLVFLQWYRLANYNFGPLTSDIVFPAYTFIDSLRLRGTDYTETVRSEISTDMAASWELNDAWFAGKTFQRVGLLALESLSFETAASEHSQAVADILAEYGNAPRKCDILQGLARQLAARAESVYLGWVDDFSDSGEAYRDLFLSAQLDDGAAPLSLLIVSVQEYMDYLHGRNVVLIGGQISAAIWDAMAASIDEVALLLEGSENTSVSFADIMESTGNLVALETVRATIAAARQSITDQDASVLEIRLGQLDGHFKREIPDSLDIELGINFSDGD